MFPYKLIIFYMFSSVFISATAEYIDLLSNDLSEESALRSELEDLFLVQDKLRVLEEGQQEKVKIQLYYECMCPDCRLFDTSNFVPVVKKLSEHLDIHVYPYGNAMTIVHDNGTVDILCQHGPSECYGNMLHACAIDILQNITEAIYFNSCMMDSSQKNLGSNDEAADKCGKDMNIDPEPIKSCAKGSRGFTLLKQYGDESKKVGFRYVPYLLINGVENDGKNFMRDICDAFKNPPDECNSVE